MHLHDLLRAWRDEVVSPRPQVALAEDETSGLPPELLQDRERMTVQGDLRRDERDSIQVTLFPARHEPNRPATDDALDELESALDTPLPRPLELLLRLHDGGRLYIPELPGMPDLDQRGLRLLSCKEIGEAYQEIILGVRAALTEMDASESDFARIAGRFGVRKEEREGIIEELSALVDGAESGFQLFPLVRAVGTRNYITFMAHAGKAGRVGYAFADTGYLPEDSMEYAFEGLEGWLQAILKSRACKRIVLT